MSKQLYVIAFLITTGIFLLGLLLGFVVEQKRTSYVEEQYQEQKIVFSSSQLQYEFLSLLHNEEDCPAVFKTLYTNLQNLEKTRIRLENFDRDSTLEKAQFDLLQREYLLAEIRYWMLAKRTKELCSYDVVTVLNFYSDNNDCPDCDQQAFILTYLKSLFNDRLLIFSFNSDVTEEPMVGILEAAYNVSTYPSLVIDDITYAGLRDTDELLTFVCSHYTQKPEGCSEHDAPPDQG